MLSAPRTRQAGRGPVARRVPTRAGRSPVTARLVTPAAVRRGRTLVGLRITAGRGQATDRPMVAAPAGRGPADRTIRGRGPDGIAEATTTPTARSPAAPGTVGSRAAIPRVLAGEWSLGVSEE